VVVYPRLDAAIAIELLAEYSTLDISALTGHAAHSHSRVTWYPTAPARVDERTLIDLRESVLAVARQFGHPVVPNRRSAAYTQFDRAVAPPIFQTMRIVPSDAATEGVWSFLSLVLLPDVSLWRFPNRDRREDYERVLGRPRNVFRRLWWRCFALGGAADGPASLLLEDEAVGLFERPTLGGDPRVASAIARAHLSRVTGSSSTSRTEVMRQAMKRLRRLSSIVALAALADNDLEITVDEVFDVAHAVVASDQATRDDGSEGA
jgi:hypothetical protein